MSIKLRKEDVVYVDWGQHRDIYEYAVPYPVPYPVEWKPFPRPIPVQEIEDWLVANIGENGPKSKWRVLRQHVVFKTEKDAMFFMLRWS